MDTSLEDYVLENGTLSDEQAKLVFSSLCNGIEICHANNIIHRDIKPSNTLLKLDHNKNIIECRVSDFGLACQLKQYNNTTQIFGTLPYMAPEVLNIESQYNEKIDLWSLGCTLFFSLTRNLPFLSFSIQNLME